MGQWLCECSNLVREQVDQATDSVSVSGEEPRALSHWPMTETCFHIPVTYPSPSRPDSLFQLLSSMNTVRQHNTTNLFLFRLQAFHIMWRFSVKYISRARGLAHPSLISLVRYQARGKTLWTLKSIGCDTVRACDIRNGIVHISLTTYTKHAITVIIWGGIQEHVNWQTLRYRCFTTA